MHFDAVCKFGRNMRAGLDARTVGCVKGGREGGGLWF